MTPDQIKKYLDGLPLVQALWWYIENTMMDEKSRTSVFFHLRERVRRENV